MSEKLILNCWMQSNQCHMGDQNPEVKHDTEQIDLCHVLL